MAFANAQALNVASRDERVRAILQKSIVLNDGIGMDIASLMLFGKAFPQNLNGTDFIAVLSLAHASPLSHLFARRSPRCRRMRQ